MLHLSVGWTVLNVIDQRVSDKSWKIDSKVRGDRWRPAKNPSMTKLVFLWFWMLEKYSNIYLFVDQCFYSTPTEQSSPFTLVNGFESNCYNCFWYRIVWPDWFNRRWQRFPSIFSITERGVMPYEQTVQLAQDEVLLRTRWSQILSYLFHSGWDFPVQTFSGWCHWSGRPIMDEFGVGLFLVSLVAPLSMGRPEKCDFFWTFCQWVGATCHGFIGRKSRRFT